MTRELQNALETMTGYIEQCMLHPNLQQEHLSGTGATFGFEEKLRTMYGKRFVVGFSNATTALQTICLALDLRNLEIITSPVNWGGSIAPFLLQGNKVHFLSFDPISLNIDINDLSSAVSAKTKAVLTVDYNGVPADSKSVKEFCTTHGLVSISDSAQSLGSFKDGMPAGYFADVIVLSFSPGKSVFGGEGGAVLTNDEMIYEKLLWYSQHPQRQISHLGLSNYNRYSPLNGRLNPLSAILLNETFITSMKNLRRQQEIWFDVLTRLQKEKLIGNLPYLIAPESSTYFNVVVEPESSTSLWQFNCFLKDQYPSFMAENSSINIIPFDSSFRAQFTRRFTCSRTLVQYRKALIKKKKILIKYLHQS